MSILMCCYTYFCNSCLFNSLKINKLCPYCRQVIEKNKIQIVCENIKLEKRIIYNKNETLTKLLKELINTRTILFCANDDAIINVIKILDDEKFIFKQLKGTGNVVNSIIKKYNNKEIQLLIIDAKLNGSGFNLEKTDNIIIYNYFNNNLLLQTINRAQRYGRKNNLNIYYMRMKQYLHH